MKRLILLLAVLATLASGVSAQTIGGSATQIRSSAAEPTGSCAPNGAVRYYSGAIYLCASGTWSAIAAGSGLTSLNGLTGSVQTLAVGTSGTDFAIVSSGTAHTFNIPDASASNRGLITTSTQTIAGAKTFSAATLTLSAGVLNVTGPTGGTSGTFVLTGNSNDTAGTYIKLNNTDTGGTNFQMVSTGSTYNSFNGIISGAAAFVIHSNTTGRWGIASNGDTAQLGDVKIGNSDNTARGIVFYEPNGSGSNYTRIIGQAQSGDVTYTLPAAGPASNGYVLSSTTGGTMSWVASSGGSPGGSGTELQYRSGPSTFGAVTDSSVSGSAVTIGTGTGGSLTTGTLRAIQSMELLSQAESLTTSPATWTPATLGPWQLVTPTANRTIHGISFNNTVDTLFLVSNLDTTNTLTLQNQSGSAGSASQRIIGQYSANLVLDPTETALLFRDTVNSRWRAFRVGGVGRDEVVTLSNKTLSAPTLSGVTTISGSSTVVPVTLTDAATIATNAALSNRFIVTLGGNRTLGNPTNSVNGQQIVWELVQDGTGSRTLALDTKFAFGTDITSITLSTTASKRDFLTAIYNSTADKWYVVGFIKGY